MYFGAVSDHGEHGRAQFISAKTGRGWRRGRISRDFGHLVHCGWRYQ